MSEIDKVRTNNGRVFDPSLVVKKNAMLAKRPELFLEWDFEKNDELGLNVYEVTYGSGKIAWWLGECGHNFDTTVVAKVKGRGCKYCSGKEILIGFNDMWTTNPELASMLANSEDGYKHTYCANRKMDWVCPTCDNLIEQKSINNVNRVGLSCPLCSDGVSFPEKFIYRILKNKGIEFEFEKTFPWSHRKKYDFYIPHLRCIIEVHGEHHYTGKYLNKYERDEIMNDKVKHEMAIKNGIEEYITIDAKVSNGFYIANSISQLNSPYKIWLIDDFPKIETEASQSFIIEVWELWNKGLRVGEISEITKLSRPTIRKYLKKGHYVGKCEYNNNISRKRGSKSKNFIREKREVVQLDINLNLIHVWENATAAATAVGGKTTSSNILASCEEVCFLTKGYTYMFKEDYFYKLNNRLPLKMRHNKKTKSVSVVKLDESGKASRAWKSINQANKETKIGYGKIIKYCNEKLGFMYLEDYEKEFGKIDDD